MSQTFRTTEQIEVSGQTSLLVDYSWTRSIDYLDSDPNWPIEYNELKTIHSIKFSTDGDKGIDLVPFISKKTMEEIGDQLSYDTETITA